MTLGIPSDIAGNGGDLINQLDEFEVGERAGPYMMQPPARERPPSLDDGAKFSELTAWIRKQLMDAKPHVEKYRNRARQNYRFMSGKQYPDADLALMKSRGRAVAAFNNIQKYVRFVSGIQRRAPLALLYVPLIEDKQQQQFYADYLTRCSDWQLNVSQARFHHGRIFEDLLIAGMAWSDQFIDKHKDPGGLPGYKRLNPLEMIWPQSSEANLGGTRWRGRQSDIAIDQAIRKWPAMKAYIQTAAGNADMQLPSREMPNVIKYVVPWVMTEPITRISGGSQTPKKDKVPITEFQWWEDEMGVYFYDPIQTVDRWLPEKGPKNFYKYRDNAEAIANVKIQDFDRVEKRTYWRTFLLGDQYMLESPKRLPTEDDFCFNAVTGNWDDTDKVWYGFVDALIGPQEYANRYMNQTVEIIAYNGKGGMLYESDAIDEGQVKEAELNFARPGSWTRVKPGSIAGNKIREKTLGQVSPATMELMQYAVNSMENVTGLSTQMFGAQAGATPGSGASGRQRMFAGLLLLAGEFDSFAQFKRKDAEIALAHIKMLADDRLISVGDAADPDILRLMRSPFETRILTMIEETDMDPTAKQYWSDQIMSIAPALIRTGNFLPDILDFVMMPAKARVKMKQAITQSAQQKSQMAQQGLSVGGRGKARSIEEIKGHVEALKQKAALDFAKAQHLMGETRRDDLTSTLSALLDFHAEKRERQKHSMDLAKGALDMFTQGMQQGGGGNGGA